MDHIPSRPSSVASSEYDEFSASSSTITGAVSPCLSLSRLCASHVVLHVLMLFIALCVVFDAAITKSIQRHESEQQEGALAPSPCAFSVCVCARCALLVLCVRVFCVYTTNMQTQRRPLMTRGAHECAPGGFRCRSCCCSRWSLRTPPRYSSGLCCAVLFVCLCVSGCSCLLTLCVSYLFGLSRVCLLCATHSKANTTMFMRNYRALLDVLLVFACVLVFLCILCYKRYVARSIEGPLITRTAAAWFFLIAVSVFLIFCLRCSLFARFSVLWLCGVENFLSACIECLVLVSVVL